MKRNQSFHQTNSRPGFTLVELLVVIVIMAILMALILPAIGRVRASVRVAQVSAEITQLDQAIASFKAVFGTEPPSNLLIPAVGGTWDSRSRSIVRSFWPQFDFATNGGLGNTTAFHLNGAECLVFFLGGLESGSVTAGTGNVTGFSKNPRQPWSGSGDNREGPFYKEFDSGRFSDRDGDGLFEYLDPLPDQTTPYLYFSSQGQSYDKQNSGGTTLAEQDDFDVHGGPANTSDMSFIYLKNVRSNPSPPPANLPGDTHRPNGYQIISPGPDLLYGTGGVYTNGTELVGARLPEADNITNFAGGMLRP